MAALYSALSKTPIDGISTYSLSSVPNAYFGRIADWLQTSGKLVLSMSPPTTLAESISASATQVVVTDTVVSNIRLGTFVKVDQELLLVTGLAHNTLTVVRGMSQTMASQHSVGAEIAACLAPGKEYRFSFPLTNAGTAQASPTVRMSASGIIASVSSIAADGDLTTVLKLPHSVAGDASPLKTYDPGFLVQNIAGE